MAAPQVMSDEQLFQLTGSWEAAAALRDQQNKALNEYNLSQTATPAVSDKQIVDFLVSNPTLTDADLVKVMETAKISPAQIAKATGVDEGTVVARVAAVVPEGMSVTLGDTNIAPQYQVIGSGEDRQVLGIENIYTMKTTGDVNYKAPVGSEYQVLNPDGTFQSTGTVKKDQSFLGGLVDALKDPVVLAALGGAAAGGLLGGAVGEIGAATGAEALGATAGTGLGTVADVVGMGSGTGITGTAAGLGINAGTTSGLSGITAGGGLTGTGVLTGSTLGAELLGTGTGLAGLTGTGLLSGSNLGIDLLGTTSTTPLVGTGVLTGSNLGTELLGTGANTAATVGGLTGLTNTANVGTGALNTGVTTGNVGLGSGALTTGVPTTPIIPTTPTTPVTPKTPVTPPPVTPTTPVTPVTPVVPPTTLPTWLTPSIINSLVSVLGAGVVSRALTPTPTNTTTTPMGVLPTQGIPLNSQDYFNAIQQNYNQIMPAVPRDVASPLAAWYNSQYGA